MTTEAQNVLVFKDQAGGYYLLPQETLDQGRIPEEHKAKVERLMVEAAENDVQGHLLVFFVGVAIGYFGTKAIMEDSEDSGITTSQMIQGWVDQANGAKARATGGSPA